MYCQECKRMGKKGVGEFYSCDKCGYELCNSCSSKNRNECGNCPKRTMSPD